jgi:hypothetical protein
MTETVTPIIANMKRDPNFARLAKILGISPNVMAYRLEFEANGFITVHQTLGLSVEDLGEAS